MCYFCAQKQLASQFHETLVQISGKIESTTAILRARISVCKFDIENGKSQGVFNFYF